MSDGAAEPGSAPLDPARLEPGFVDSASDAAPEPPSVAPDPERRAEEPVVDRERLIRVAGEPPRAPRRAARERP